MNVSSFRLALLAGLALPLGLATASLAQDAPTNPAAGPPAGDHHWDPAERRARMAEHLSAVLQLQPSQQSALAAYLDALKPPGDMKPQMDQAQGDVDHAPTPERLDRMMARFDQMHARMVARVAATKQFYAQLSPGQQKAFDELAPTMHRFGGGRGGMDGRRGGGWGHQMGPDGQSPG
jgi:periplasmic protein CpxP/Spy